MLVRLGGTFDEIMATPYGIEMKRKMALGGNRTLWEMNIRPTKNSPYDEWIRTVAQFGYMRLTRWSWFKSFVALPLAKTLACIMTKLDI